MKLLKKHCLCLTLGIILLNLCTFSFSVRAADGDAAKVFYLSKSQSISGTLFSGEELIGPGDKLVKEFYIENTNDYKCTLEQITADGKLYGTNNVLLKEVDEQYKNYVKYSNLSFYCEDKMIFSGNVQDALDFSIAKEDNISLNKGERKRFVIEYSLSDEADKSVMGMLHKFNIDFNFSGVEALEEIVQTGSVIDTKVLIGLGTIISAAGVALLFKKKK